jgi:glucose-1-phosphate cytidylyltransferase
MKTVILCGGKGSRLGEVTEGLIPKPMVEIGGRPILWHLMDYYARAGHAEFILCAGHKSTHIKNYFMNYRFHNADVRFCTGSGEVQFMSGVAEDWDVLVSETGEDTQTAGRLARVAKYIGEGEDFFLTYGDGLSDIDLAALIEFHRSHGRLVTMSGVVPPGRFGEMTMDGDRIAEMHEKPDQSDRYINGGFMVINRRFVDQYCKGNADAVMLERAPLERAALDGELMLFRHLGFWQCMDTARDWSVLDTLAKQEEVPWAR